MLMKISRFPVFNPVWDDVLNLERGLGSVLDAFSSPSFDWRANHSPSMSLAEGADQSTLIVELPGVIKEDVKISVEDGLLTIAGERRAPELPEGARWIRSESLAGKFVRTLELPHPVDPQAISAELSNGLLRVVLPKAEAARPREITIR